MLCFFSTATVSQVARKLAVLVAIFVVFNCTSAQTRLYVATNGNDLWNGRAASLDNNGNGPKKTLKGARDEIRKLKLLNQLSAAGAIVLVRPGRYRQTEPLQLQLSDSGKSSGKVVFKSEVLKKAVLDGGIDITKWLPSNQRPPLDKFKASVRPYILVADLQANGITETGKMRHNAPNYNILPEWAELFFDDQRMNIAQWPNSSGVMMSGNGSGNGNSTPTVAAQLSNLRTPNYRRQNQNETDTDYWVRGTFNERLFNQFQERVTWVDKIAGELRYAIEDGNVDDQARRAQYDPNNKGRFVLVNSIWELDVPGEYYIDRGTNLLYFYPSADLLNKKTYLSMNPSSVVSFSGCSYIDFIGFTVEGGRQNGITTISSNRVNITGNTVKNCGGFGISVSGGSNVIVGSNVVYNIGETGIYLEGGNRASLIRGNHVATNNYVHHVGQVQPYYRPCLRLTGFGLTARNNELAYHRHQAIHFFGNEHLIEYNRIHHVVQDALDSAGIYAGDGDWTTRGNVIRYNYLSDIREMRVGYHVVHGIYLDDMNSSTNVYSNIFRNVEQPIQIGGGHDNKAERNVFVDCFGGVRIDDRGLAAIQTWIDDFFRLAENVPWRGTAWRTKYPEVYELLIGNLYRYPTGNSIVGNVSLRNRVNNKVGGIWELWGVNNNAQSWILTFDKNLATDEQQFADEPNGNFTPLANSQAFANGFQPVTSSSIGVKKDSYIDPATW